MNFRQRPDHPGCGFAREGAKAPFFDVAGRVRALEAPAASDGFAVFAGAAGIRRGWPDGNWRGPMLTICDGADLRRRLSSRSGAVPVRLTPRH